LTKQTANLKLSKPEMADKISTSITQLANNFDAIDATFQDHKSRVDNIVAGAGNSNTEIVDARGGKVVLKDRLDAVDASLAEKAKQSDLDNTNTTLASKLTKGLAQVTLADLSQEVKTSMTGGSVAVVGENAVLNATIGDNQVTTGKSNYFIKKGNLFDKNHPNNIMNWNIYTSGTEAAQNGFLLLTIFLLQKA
jgi:hypothetical protein